MGRGTGIHATFLAIGAKAPEFEPALAKLANDPALSVQMLGIKGIWQFWFWTPDAHVKNDIEDTLLAKMKQPQPVWIESNLHDAIYNLADENVRYLYNNWVPLLGQEEDRDRAIRGRLSIEARLANKFAAVLDRGSDSEKKELMRFLAVLRLRRADVYDLNAGFETSPRRPLHNRIRDDIEQIVFFGPSAERLAHSLSNLLDSKDPETRHLAAQAVLLIRTYGFWRGQRPWPGPYRARGPSGFS